MHQLKFIFVVSITCLSIFDVDCSTGIDYGQKYKMVLAACESDTSLLDPAMVRILKSLKSNKSTRCQHAVDDVYAVLSQYGYINKQPSSHIISVLAQVVQHKFILPAAGCASTAYMALKSSGLFALSSIAGGGYGFAGLTSTVMLSGMALSAGTYIWNTLCASNKAILDHQRAEAMRAAVWRALQPVQLFKVVNTAVREERIRNAKQFSVLTKSVHQLTAKMNDIQSGVQECIARAESAVETKNNRDILNISAYINAQLETFSEAFMTVFSDGILMIMEDKAKIDNIIQRVVQSQKDTVELLQSLTKASDKSVHLSQISQKITDMRSLLATLQAQCTLLVSKSNCVLSKPLESPRKQLRSVVFEESGSDLKQSASQQRVTDLVGKSLLRSRFITQSLSSCTVVNDNNVTSRFSVNSPGASALCTFGQGVTEIQDKQKNKSVINAPLLPATCYSSLYSKIVRPNAFKGKPSSLLLPAFVAGGGLYMGASPQLNSSLYDRFNKENLLFPNRNCFYPSHLDI